MTRKLSSLFVIDSLHKNNAGVEYKVLDRFVFGGRGTCTIRFIVSGFVKDSLVSNLCMGKVKDPYHKSVHGVGCVGLPSKYYIEDYHRWNNMLERCYTDKEKFSAWEFCTVSDSWLCFENFIKDLKDMENYGKPNMHLDKDLLVQGNKIYSKETCKLVHMNLNSSHGKFTGLWRAERDGTVIETTFSAELAKLIGVKKSTVRVASTSGSTTRGGWKITKVA